MARQTKKTCLHCKSTFYGRSDAKTCSARCRKAWQRAQQTIAAEARQIENKFAEIAKEAEQLIVPLTASEAGFIETAEPQTVVVAEPPQTPPAYITAEPAGPAETAPQAPAPAEPSQPLQASWLDNTYGAADRPVGADVLPNSADIAPAELRTPVQPAAAAPEPAGPMIELGDPAGQVLYEEEDFGQPSRWYGIGHGRVRLLRAVTAAVVLLAGIGIILGFFSGHAKKPQTSGPSPNLSSLSGSGLVTDNQKQSLHINFKTLVSQNLSASGSVLIQNDSTNGLQVQSPDGSNLLVVDTIHQKVGVGGAPAGAAKLQVIGDLSSSGQIFSTQNSYKLNGQGLFLDGVLVCTATGCAPNSNPSLTGVARLSANQTFTGVNRFTSGGNVFVGDGSGLSALNAGNITSGTLSDSRLSGNVALRGANNDFTGTDTFTSQIQAGGGVNASAYSVGGTAGSNFACASGNLLQNATVSGGIITGGSCAAASGLNPTLQNVYDNSSPAQIVLNSTNGAFDIQDAVTPIGVNLFEVQSNGGGTTYFAVSSNGIDVSGNVNTNGQYQVNGSQISSSNLSDSANLAKLNGNQTFSGTNTFSNAGNNFTGNGSGLANVNAAELNGQAGSYYTNASNISAGTLNDARLSNNVTLAGNTFNGASELVQLTAGGILPVLNGSNLTSLNASSVSSGTLNDARLSANVTLAGNTFNGASELVQLDSSGNLPALNGSALFNLDASNISIGTLNDARLSANVTLAGNTFNGANELVQLDSFGRIPVLDARNVTNLNASNVASGTLNDARLSSNVALLDKTEQVFTGDNIFKLDSATAFQIQNSLGNSNLFVADTTDSKIGIGLAPSSTGAALQVSGTVDASTGFSVNGSAGLSSLSCAANELLQHASISGGIVTGGNCVAPAGQTTPTFQDVYDASIASPQITLDSSPGAGGLVIQDNTTPIVGDLFDVQNNGGSTKYLAVLSSGVSVAGDINITGQYKISGVQISTADLSDAANIALLNGNQTFTGANTFSNASNSFTGSGSGLTNLNASNVSSGTLSDARLSANVALKNANNIFTGDNSFTLNSKALSVQDASTPLGATLFQITDNSGATKYFTVSATALQFLGNDVCTSGGNCVGVAGGAIGGGGTAGKLAKFTGSGFTVGDSIISDNGSTVTIGGTLSVNTITPTASMTVGDTGQGLTLQGNGTTTISATASGVTNSIVFAAPTGLNKTITVPNASGTVAVSASGPLSLDAAGNLTCPDCLTTNGSGGGNGVTDVNGISGSVTLAGTANQVIITPSTGTLTLSTPQDIGTSSNVSFGSVNVTGQYKVGGSQISSADLSNDANLAKLSASQTFTGNNTFSNSITAPGITAGGAALGIGASTDTLNLNGTYSSDWAVTNGTNSTTIGFSGTPTANVAYNFDATAPAGTYTICTTANPAACAAAGGVTTSSAGTNGTIAIFTGAQTIANSIITQSGTTVTIAGTLNATTLQQGGTGVLLQSTAFSGDVSGTYNATSVDKLKGTALSINTLADTNFLIYNSTTGNWENHSVSGDIAIDHSGVATIQPNSVALGTDTTGNYVANLGSLTGLTTSGNSGEGSTPTLSVTYGSGANTAVQGNTALTCASGTGNLTGGGNVVTLGAGGSCNNITITNTPTFSSNVAAGFQIQDSSTSQDIMNINTLNDQLELGTAGPTGTNGTVVFNNSAGTHTVGLSLQADPGSSYTLLLPTTGPGTGECLQTDNTTANQLVFGNCSGSGSGVTTVGTYSSSNHYANGASISGSTITLGSADATHPGLVDTSNQTFSGDKTFATNSATGFQVQNSSSSKNVLTVDTSSNIVGIGASGASGITGDLQFNFAGQTGNISLIPANPSSTAYTLTLPAENGTICTTAGSAACTSIYGGGSGSTTTLAQAYANGSSSASQTLALTSGHGGGLLIQDANGGLGGTLFAVQDFSGSTSYLGVTATGISVAGSATVSGNINTSGGTIQTGGTNRIDNSGNLVNIGNITASGTYDTNAFNSSALTFGASAAASVDAASGQNLNLGAGASAHTTVLGSTTGASATNIQAGTGGIGLTGTTTITGNTTIAGTNTFTVNGGNTSLGANLDVTSSVAYKHGVDVSTTGNLIDLNIGNVSLIRLSGASAQTLEGIANGRDGYIVTVINAGSANATIADEAAGETTLANRIRTGTGGNISLAVNSSITLVYDSQASRWRVVGDVAGGSGAAVTSVGTFTSCTSYANGAQISGGVITFSCADITNPGMVSTGAQTWAGAKTFNALITGNAGLSVSGGAVSLTGNAASSLTTTSGALSLQGAGGVNLTTTNVASGSSSAITIASGNVTAGAGASGSVSIDVGTSTGTTGTVSIGTANASAVSIGLSGKTTTVNGALTVSQSLTANGGITVGANQGISFNAGSGSFDAHNATGTFQTSSGNNSLNGNTTVTGTNTFTVNGGLTSLGANVDVTGALSLKWSSDFSTTPLNNLSVTSSLIRLTGASAQTLTGVSASGGNRNGELLTIVNAGSNPATISNLNAGSSSGNQITTGTGADISLPIGASITLIYDNQSSPAVWRVIGQTAGSSGSGATSIGTYTNCTSYANGAQISGNVLTLGCADATHPGLIDNGSQTFGGAKTFNNLLTGSAGLTVTGGAVQLNASSNNNTSINTGSSTGSVTIGNGSAGAIGLTSGAGISLSGGAASSFATTAGTLTLQGFAGTSLLTTNASGANTSAITIASGNVTAGAFASGNVSIDVGTSTGTTGTISIGTANASAVSIGKSGVTTTNNGALTVTQNLTVNGAATFKDSTNSTSAFNIVDNSNNSVLNADTVNRYVGINNSTPNATLDVRASSSSFFDGFETGSLSPFSSTGIFAAATGDARTGSYSANAESSGSTSTLSLTRTLNSAGTITFYIKRVELVNCFTSTTFLIDGVTKGTYTGCSNGGYVQQSFATTSGTHTFSWSVQATSGYTHLDDITITNAGVGNTALFNGGNVGIGTSFPNTTLDVTGTAHFQASTDSATEFQIQSASAAETLFTIDTTARSASGGNLVKIGNNTSTDGNTTILVVDSATAAPTSNLGALNGGLFYNSTTNHLNVIENGVVKELCNKTDLGCGSAATPTLAQVYGYGASQTDETIGLDSTRLGVLIRDNSTPIGGTLFGVQNSTGATKYLDVSATTVAVNGNFTASGTINTNTFDNAGNLTFGNAGAANINAASGQNLNLGTGASNHTTTLGSTNGTSATAIQSGSGGINLNGNTTVNAGKTFTADNLTYGQTGNATATTQKNMTVFGAVNANDVVQIYSAVDGEVTKSTANSTTVFGIATTTNAATAAQNIVISGVFQVNADAAALAPGDLLVASGTSGLVTKASSAVAGSIVGRALSTKAAGAGTVWVQLSIGGGGNTTLQTAYNNSTSPQITLGSSLGGLVVQDASSPIGAALFTVQNNGGTTKYFNVDATGATVNGGLTSSGGAVSLTGNAASSLSTTAGNLTLQAGSGIVTLGTSTSLTASGALNISSGGTSAVSIDTSGAAGVNIGTGNTNAITIGNATNNSAITLNSGTGTIGIGTGNQARTVDIGTGAAAQAVVIGSTTGASGTTIYGGSNGISLSANTTVGNDNSLTAKGSSTFAANTNSATAFQVQNSGAADTLLSINTLTRTSGVAGNIIKVGNSTGTDANTTILVLDSSTAAPTTNLTSLNGGLFYNSTTGHIDVVEGGQVKELCNKTDQACGTGTGVSTTLSQAYNNGAAAADQTLALTTTHGGGLLLQDQAVNSVNGTLFQVQNASGNQILTVDDSANQVTLGKGSSLAGKLVFSNSTNGNTVTLLASSSGDVNGAPAGNLVFKLPSADGSSGQCLGTDGAGNLAFNNCSGNSGGGAGNANRQLSNLSGVAINASLTPGTANSIDLGSSSDVWRAAYIRNLSTDAATDLLLSPTTGVVKIDTASQSNELRVFENAVSPTNYTSITNNSITNTSGNLTLNAAGGTIILGANTATLQKSGTGFTFDLNSASNSTFTLTNSGAGIASLSVEGGVGIGSGQTYNVGAATGQTVSCSAGNTLTGAAFTGGVLTTAGTCSSITSTPTFAAVYSAGATQADETATLVASKGGIIIQDAVTPIGADLFTVESNGGTNKFLDVTSNGISVTGNVVVSSTYNGNTFDNAGNLTFGNAGAANINAASGQTLNLGAAANAHTTVLGSTTGGSTTNIQSGSGGISLSGNTSVSGSNTFSVGTGTTSLGGDLNVAGSLATKKGSDYTTTGTDNNVNFGDVSLVRLTGASAQTITGIANGRDGYTLTIVNAGATTATLKNNDTIDSSAANIIITGTGGDITLPSGASVSLIYDAGSSVWRVEGSTTGTNGSYIQNQNAVVQTANFRISGTGEADSSLLTPSLDALSGGALALGGANATGVTIGGSTNTTSVQLQGAASATYTIGTATGTGTITLGQSTAGEAINIGHAQVATGNTQTINIGDQATGTGKDVITIGNTNGASSVSIRAGTGGVGVTGNLAVSGNINSSGGAIQTSGTSRIDNSGNLTNIGNFTAAAGSTFATTGANGFTFKPGTDNTAFFQVQNSVNSKAVMTVDTTNGQVVLGSNGGGASDVTGKLAFDFSNQTGSITITPANPSSTNYNITLPAANGTVCLTSGNCAGVGGQIGGSGTTGTIAMFTPDGADIGNSDLTQSGSTVTNTGNFVSQTTTNSTTAFQVQNNSTTALLTGDTSNMRIGVDVTYTAMSAPSGVSASVPSQMSTPTVTPTGTTGPKTYSYIVIANLATGQSAASAAGQTTSGNATLSSTNYNAVSWSSYSGATSYNVYRTSSNGTPSTLGYIGNTTSTSFNDIGIAANGVVPTVGGALSTSTTYFYKVTAIDSAGGETTASSEVSATTGASANTTQTINVSWTAVSGASGYKIYRATTSGGEVYYATTNTNSYADSGAITVGTATPPATGNAYTAVNNSNNELQISVGGLGVPTGQVYVSGTQPILVGSTPVFSVPGSPDNTEATIVGNYAYLLDRTTPKFQIFDITNPLAPIGLSSITVTGDSSFSVAGKYAYLAKAGNGIRVVDVSNPSAPSVVNTVSLPTANTVSSTVVSGNYLYILTVSSLYVYDISNPATPVAKGYLNIGTSNQGMAIQGKYAYITANVSPSLQIVDVSNPGAPVALGSNLSGASSYYSISVQGRYVYLKAVSKMHIYDISNPYSPVLVGNVSDNNGASGKDFAPIFVAGRLAYSSEDDNGYFEIYDISNPYKPVLLNGTTNPVHGRIAGIKGRYAYVYNIATKNLEVYDLGGSYNQVLESGNLETSTLSVEGSSNFNGGANIQGNIDVGQNLQTAGNAGIGGGLNVQGSTVLDGGANQLATPGAPTVTSVGANADTVTWSYTVTAINAYGAETLASPAGSVSATDNATLTAANYNQISWSAVSGAAGYKIYRTVAGGTSPTTTGLIGSTTSTSFNDTGISANGSASPTVNTTGQLTVTGSALFQNATNSTTAFQVQNSSAMPLLTVDTTASNHVQIGSSTTDATAISLVLDSYNNGTDPTGTAGAMYYNTSLGVFRCYASSWGNCGGSETLQQAYDASASQPQITLDSSPGAKGLVIQDASTPVTGSLFSVLNSSGNTLLSVSSNGLLANDTYTRTIALNSGWGSANSGGSWTTFQDTTSTNTDFGVNGSAGQMNLSAASSNRTALLGSTSITNFDVTVRVQTSATPTGSGNGISYYILPRTTVASAGRTGYRFELDQATTNTGTVYIKSVNNGAETQLSSASVGTLATNTYYWLRARGVGSNLSFKVWQYGSAEPAGWTTQTVDSTYSTGVVGVMGFVHTGGTLLPTILWDDFSATDISGSVTTNDTLNTNVGFNSYADSTISDTSTSAFQIQNSSGTSLFTVDTTNSEITLGSASATPVLLVLGNKNTSGDPTCTNGAVYYNSNSNVFRGCQNGVWRNLMESPSNASTADQSLSAGTTTYLTNSGITIPSEGLQVGTQFIWRISLDKTDSAATAANTYIVKYGTNGTTADTSEISFTGPTQTATTDSGTITIMVTVRSVNSSTGTWYGNIQLVHNQGSAGLANTPSYVSNAVTGSFNDTTASAIVGIAVTTGANCTLTIHQVQVQTVNL